MVQLQFSYRKIHLYDNVTRSLKNETFYNAFQTLWVHNQKMMQFFFHKEKLVHKTAFQSTLCKKSIKDSRNRAPCLLS